MNTPLKRSTSVIFVIFAAMLWSTAGLLIKMIDWNPIAIAGIRSGITSIVLYVFILLLEKKQPKKPDKYVVVASINYVVLVFLFVSANKLTTAANAILLQFTSPAWILIVGVLFFKEKFYRKDLIAVIVVFLGMALFFMGDIEAGGMFGNILSILSGLGMALLVFSLKRVKNHSPLEIVFWGNLVTFFVSIPSYGGIVWTSSSIIGIVLLGVFQLGFSYVFFTKGIAGVTALEAILLPVFEPLLNPVWVYLGTGELPTMYALIGGAVVLVAVIAHSQMSTGAAEIDQ